MYKEQNLFKINPTERIISMGKMYLDLISLLGITHYIIALNRSCTHKFSLAPVSGSAEHSSYMLLSFFWWSEVFVAKPSM